ncbi:toll-like receptor 4 [Pecten maximus]|uniref:toll-like receptor 4 n=1 Tax=Pecten maximus TaxID=6579 RepID=UPI0014591746|nr:toll-like receptor 4 [Pecten maximus]
MTKVSTHCVDVANCSCFQHNTIADCSRKQLSFVPNFQPNVTKIDLSFNIISTLLPGKYVSVKSDSSVKPRKSNGPFTSLSHLKFLDLSNNKLQYKPEVFPVGVFEGLVNLETLYIQHNNNYNEDQANLIYPQSLSKLTKLKRLRIDGLDATLNISRILPTMLALEELNISGASGMCYIKKFEAQFFKNVPNLDIKGKTFERLTNLEIIDLSSNRIAELGSMILKNQANMTTLNLSSNLLRKFDVKIGHMEKLQYLDLSDNQLPYLDPSSMSEINNLLARTNLSIDLSNNPIQCSCEKLEFLRWMVTNKRVFSKFEKYQCSFSNGTTVSFHNHDSPLVELEVRCASYVPLIVCVVTAIVLSLSVAIGGLVYRYRWKLRYLFYIARNNFTLSNNVRKDRRDRLLYKYDAFISHADEDSEFVVGDLLQNMEETRQFTICVHQRDFIAGRDIAGNITNAIHNSRKTVLILSPDFLRSNWCMFEFNMARMEGIYSRENTSNIFIVFYKHVRPEDLPLTVMEFINSETYLEYPGDLQGNAVFWDKMAQALAV